MNEHFISIFSPKHAAFPEHFICHQAKKLSGRPTRINSSLVVAVIVSELNRYWKFRVEFPLLNLGYTRLGHALVEHSHNFSLLLETLHH